MLSAVQCRDAISGYLFSSLFKQRHFSVRGAFDAVKQFDKVSVKMLDTKIGGEWVFKALNGDELRLIFPGYLVDVDTDESAGWKITANLHADRDIPITIGLDDGVEFDELKKLMRQVWIR